ncbi:MAG: hypothetical protein LAN37_15285 [Acidobacteriia bacterium]|nr:hypothetical protein [Terriglobia bacterium]
MRNRRILYVCVVLALCGTALAAPACINGRGEIERQLWDGYTLKIGPTDDPNNPCYAGVLAADGKAIFEIWGVDAAMESVTGRDVNNDGKPDVVLLTHNASSSDNVYSILGTGDPAGLIRQIVTGATLSFEDRKGDGHTEIVTRDTAFREFDGLTPEQSPAPLLFLRLKGKEIYNVSTAYWPEYEREIQIARGKLGKNDISDFKGDLGTTPSGVGGGGKDKPKEETPQEIARKQETKAIILEIVLDNIYGGKGQEAWQALKEMWPYADRDRVRQAILKTRMSGVLGDINRPAAKQASAQ